MASLILWVAQGFGAGRIPVAPGTFGSLVGVLWCFLLIKAGSLWAYLGGTLAGLALSVWLCGKAEETLKQTDPSSIVLDEITAMPVCFLPWTLRFWLRDDQWPRPEDFWNANGWVGILMIFILFRLFDIAKPWPVRQSQKLPRGWGVTADDVLAAIYTGLLSGIPLLL
jgi:phosphatidylglycerophosphatase A